MIPPKGWFTSKTVNMPPLGISYISAVLEKHGYGVELLDAHTEKCSFDDIERRIKRSKPDIIGVSFTTETRFNGFKTIKIAKRANPSSVVVTGGPHVSLAVEDTLLNMPELDIIVRGEGEFTFLDLVKTLDRDEDISRVEGISYRDDGQVVHNPPRPFIKDLDSLPFPTRHLLQIDKYNSFIEVPGKGKKKFFNVIGSRGCPNRCYFCAASLLSGRTWRGRSPENIINEIEHLIDTYEAEGIWFWDDTFNLENNRAKKICDLITERGLDIDWFCDIRVDTADKELLTKMRQAGCFHTAFGVESGSQEVLDKYVKKRIAIEKVKKVKKWCAELGIIGRGMFIISHPDETFTGAKKTIDLIKELGGINSINVLKIYPGTEIERMAKERGILPKTFTWTKPFNQGVDVLYSFIGNAPLFLDKMSIEEIMQLLYMWAELQKDPIHQRALTALKSVKSYEDLVMLLKIGKVYFKRKILSN